MSPPGDAAAPGGPGVAQELPRAFAVTRVGDGAVFVVEARPEECAALAGRMGLDAIHSLVCRFELRRESGHVIAASGRLEARVRQSCVVSLDAFDAQVSEEFSLRFVPEGEESEDLDLESADEVPYADGVLQLGEAASEQLALALDPFPRRPGAVLDHDLAEDGGGAFAALARLLPPN